MPRNQGRGEGACKHLGKRLRRMRKMYIEQLRRMRKMYITLRCCNGRRPKNQTPTQESDAKASI